MKEAEDVKPTEQVGEEELYIPKSIGEFAAVLAAWHADQVADLNQMAKMPVGVTMQKEGEEDRVMGGDLHMGFMMGLDYAKALFGELPFVIKPLKASDDAATPESKD